MDNRSTDMMNDAIDLCSCYEPICEPPVNLLEEWQDSEYAGPEPTLENTSYYVKEPDGTLYFYCGNTKIKMTEHFAENGKQDDIVRFRIRGARCAGAAGGGNVLSDHHGLCAFEVPAVVMYNRHKREDAEKGDGSP